MAEKTPEEKHLEIMLAIGEIKTVIKKVVEPAIGQVYENERAILTLNNNANNAKDSRGRLISYAALGLSLVVTALAWIRLYKPPNLPH